MYTSATPWLDEECWSGIMNTCQMSLRNLVEKWVGVAQVRVTQFCHTRQEPWRYVRIEAQLLPEPVALIFFRHDDGSWCVFPPQRKRPEMSTGRDASQQDLLLSRHRESIAAS
jgi:hypothetical protein